MYLTLGILGSRAKGPRPREPRPGLIKNIPFRKESFFVPGKKYFAGNYGFTLKKIESVVVVVVVVIVVVVKSSERFKALPIELES